MTSNRRTFDEWCDDKKVTESERRELWLYLMFLRMRPFLELMIKAGEV